MNRVDLSLRRLWRAAAQAEPTEPSFPPHGLETRVLASWRAGRFPAVPAGWWNVRTLLRGLAAAGLVMVLSLGGAALQAREKSPFSDYLQLADTAAQWGGNAP